MRNSCNVVTSEVGRPEKCGSHVGWGSACSLKCRRGGRGHRQPCFLSKLKKLLLQIVPWPKLKRWLTPLSSFKVSLGIFFFLIRLSVLCSREFGWAVRRMLLRNSCTSCNELNAERRRKITSHEYCTANGTACFQAHSHLQWAHFVKFSQMERLNVFCSPLQVTMTRWIMIPGGSRWKIILIFFYLRFRNHLW